MKRQELFDKAVQGIKDQGCLSKCKHSGCFYRHPDNPAVRCAVGHLIPDEIYTSEMDVGDSTLTAKFVTRFPQLPTSIKRNRSFLEELQYAHDEACDVEDFLTRAKTIAKKFRLKTAVCS